MGELLSCGLSEEWKSDPPTVYLLYKLALKYEDVGLGKTYFDEASYYH
jgi:hypothetical protein